MCYSIALPQWWHCYSLRVVSRLEYAHPTWSAQVVLKYLLVANRVEPSTPRPRVPERRRTEILTLVSLVNEQLWVGHFDLWSTDNVVMFRHSLLLTGGAAPTQGQCTMMLKSAVDACERYYQAFQFVLWAGKSAREALDAVLFETEGEA